MDAGVKEAGWMEEGGDSAVNYIGLSLYIQGSSFASVCWAVDYTPYLPTLVRMMI